jgi:beta-1,4-mannosyl-glycoprotein beta-1,4-N-acetylglucosaminyltransferase
MPDSRPLVVDVFCYNGEAIVERRLRYLDPVVDMFVVVEARETHAGDPKPVLYVAKNRAIFAKYAHKTTFLIIDAFPPAPPDWPPPEHTWILDNHAAWWRECCQRDAALPLLRGLHVKDRLLALVCDADEIPSRDAVHALAEEYDLVAARPSVHLSMSMHYYSFEYSLPQQWFHPFAIAGARLGSSLTAVRCERVAALLPDAGWHCSYFMEPHEIKRKIMSFAHREFDDGASADELAERVASGADVLGRDGAPLVHTPLAVLAAVPAELLQ